MSIMDINLCVIAILIKNRFKRRFRVGCAFEVQRCYVSMVKKREKK